jgi:hypothetical protein
MIRLAVRRVHPGEEDRLREWLNDLNTTRADEARATLVDEGCSQEIGVLVSTSDGLLLVHAMDVLSEEQSKLASQKSQHPIDLEHRRIMGAALDEEPELERLLDLRADI